MGLDRTIAAAARRCRQYVLDGKIHLLGGRDISVQWMSRKLGSAATDKILRPHEHGLDPHAAFS